MAEANDAPAQGIPVVVVETTGAWWTTAFAAQLLTSLIILALWLVGSAIMRRAVASVVEDGADRIRAAYIRKFLSLVLVVLTIVALGITWGIRLAGVWVVLSTLFTIIGIALFAVWSMLSNITAALILYFAGPFRLGSRVRIGEGDGFEGVVEDMTLFHVRLQTAEGTHFIPNNIVMQRAVTVVSGATPTRQFDSLRSTPDNAPAADLSQASDAASVTDNGTARSG